MQLAPIVRLVTPDSVVLQNVHAITAFAEDLDKQAHGGPSGYAKETARCKALDVRRSLRSKAIVPDLIISADTVSTHPPAKAKQTCPELDPSGTSLQF